MARKSKYSYLLEKSVNAAISAIEIYNKPDFKYREESFSILMVNAWETLLKAKIVFDNKNDLKSIQSIDTSAKKKNGEPFKRPKYKVNRSGNYMTIDIFSAIKKLDLHERLGENIELLVEIRDNAIHFFNESKLFRNSVFLDLDAPAAVSVLGVEKAVADFYNNRILFNDGHVTISFGKEGKGEGEFYYPTDVQLTDSLIWVADAYNNRVQVFDKKGNFLKMIGHDQKMNAATGIFVSQDEVLVTDFENDRVLVFDYDGNLKQELNDSIEKPTDMIIFKEQLNVINYRSGQISIFKLAEISQVEQ